MKNIFFTNITEVGKQKVPLKAKQGMSLSKTPAPQSEKIYGSDVNKKGSSSSLSSAKNIKLTDKTMTSIKNLVKTFNKKNPDKKIAVPAAKAVVRRGMGAYSSTHRPTITGGRPNSRVAWGLARLKAFLYKAEKGKSKSGNYVQDDDLFKELGIRVKSYETGGELEKGIRAEKEHSKTIHDIYTHKIPENKAFEAIAKDHIKENPNYYSNMNKYAEGGLVISGVEVNNGDTGVLSTRKGDINITIKNITENWVIFIDEEGKRKDNPRDKFIENFTPSQGGVIPTKAEPQNLANRIEKLKETSIPSTDPSTWNAEYSIGDVVKIRVDMEDRYPFTKPDGTPVKYEDGENSSVITQIETLEDAKRPENPSGKLYTLGLKGTWEGKDLELAYVVDKKQSQVQTAKQQKTATTKPQKTAATFEPENEPPVYFDKESDFVKLYENFLQNNSEIQDYSLISQAEVIQNISSNFEISIENLDKEIEEIKNKPKITEPLPQPEPQSKSSNNITIENLEIWNEKIGMRNYSDAIELVKKLGEGWRLPTGEEFTDIIYPNRNWLVSIDMDDKDCWFTGETPGEAYYYDLLTNNAVLAEPSNSYFVLPVRDLSQKTATSSTSTTQPTQGSQNLDPITIDFSVTGGISSAKLEFTADETVELKAQYDLRINDETKFSIGDVFNAIKLGQMYVVLPENFNQSLFLVEPYDVKPTMKNSTILINPKEYMSMIKEKIEKEDYSIFNKSFSFTQRERIECEGRMNFNSVDSQGDLMYFGEGEIYNYIDIGPFLIFSDYLNISKKKIQLIPKTMVEILDYGNEFITEEAFADAKVLDMIADGDFHIAERA